LPFLPSCLPGSPTGKPTLVAPCSFPGMPSKKGAPRLSTQANAVRSTVRWGRRLDNSGYWEQMQPLTGQHLAMVPALACSHTRPCLIFCSWRSWAVDACLPLWSGVEYHYWDGTNYPSTARHCKKGWLASAQQPLSIAFSSNSSLGKCVWEHHQWFG
jgi:hypothetical protein